MNSGVNARADSGPGADNEFDRIVFVGAKIIGEREVSQPDAPDWDVDFCRVERESVCSCHGLRVAWILPVACRNCAGTQQVSEEVMWTTEVVTAKKKQQTIE
jgi:hypothetical protein